MTASGDSPLQDAADGRKWKDHATGEGGDAVDFLAQALTLSSEDVCKKLIELGVCPFPNTGSQSYCGAARLAHQSPLHCGGARSALVPRIAPLADTFSPKGGDQP